MLGLTLTAQCFGASFLICGLIYSALDVWNPEWYASKRRGLSQIETVEDRLKHLGRALPVVCKNILLAGIFMTWVIPQLYEEPVWPTHDVGYNTIKLSFQVLVELVLMYVVSQLLFYTSHRWVHTVPWLYKTIHSQHHQMTSPFAITALYCSAWELFVLNLPAVCVPFLVVQPTAPSLYLWMTLAGAQVCMAHSGQVGSEYHDLHHAHLKGNYGSWMLDHWLGTEIKKETTRKRKRSRIESEFS
jgi:sterol desaturase/sphingolipid hydroxylase (fatty acid hydroxylase superfamily)